VARTRSKEPCSPSIAARPTSPQHRIEIYRKLAQATEKSALENLSKELRDRFGPLPPPVELLLAVGELKILASEKAVTAIEVEEDKLKITRHNDFITLGGKFQRLTKKEAKARLMGDQTAAVGNLKFRIAFHVADVQLRLNSRP
jgi:transcription-repair coupling factor (superfamily II helicase)